MKNMNNQMKLPQLQKIMQEFEMENEKNEMIQEATGDAMDDAFADDEDEEEEDRIVNEVLDQIGVDLTGTVRSVAIQISLRSPPPPLSSWCHSRCVPLTRFLKRRLNFLVLRRQQSRQQLSQPPLLLELVWAAAAAEEEGVEGVVGVVAEEGEGGGGLLRLIPQ
jgi:hypothetical protein